MRRGYTQNASCQYFRKTLGQLSVNNIFMAIEFELLNSPPPKQNIMKTVYWTLYLNNWHNTKIGIII